MRSVQIVRNRRETAGGFALTARASEIAAAPPFPSNCSATWAAPDPGPTVPLHDPPLRPRDEAIALLHATAEVEHSLMVQYLYAAYSLVDSLPAGDPRAGGLRLLRELLTHIAREEMAHLATVQNLLRLVGGPLHFDREHSPFASELLPFRFKLEPLSLGSLAKYIVAESPRQLPETIPEAERQQIYGEVTDRAKAANDGVCPGHVGDIFRRLIDVFENQLADDDFRPGTEGQQAHWNDWGFDPVRRTYSWTKADGVTVEPVVIDGGRSLVEVFAGNDPAVLRQAAVEALRKIAEQGEGFDGGPDAEESHFEWFWLLFRVFEGTSQLPGDPIVRLVPITPNTSLPPAVAIPVVKLVDRGLEAFRESGRIVDPRSRRWAQLFDLRYRLLLEQLAHFMRRNEPLYDAQGDRTARGRLQWGVFREMVRLQRIARKLVQLPLVEASDPRRAGPPFELPYTTQLPDDEPERWRRHLDANRAAQDLTRALLSDPADAADPFLADLLRSDQTDEAVFVALATGQAPPPALTDFPKVAQSLEEAVRGFTIGASHGHFWEQPLQDFIAAQMPTLVPGDPANSMLVRRLRGQGPGGGFRMPRERPPLPESRIAFIEAWIAAGCPSSIPADHPGIVRERDPAPEPAPPPINPANPGLAVSFASQIRPLFTESDVLCMQVQGLDLSSYDQVQARATAILAVLRDGTMPLGGAWPTAQIDLFERWIMGGKQP